ncbi:hypothetical protein [Sorangium sp. So ce1099]|uniref:hypothetical protein n=1 Tax=Sorangium sp. So ce1099 TaxID=3133331 RepID=UPI003F61EB8C
MPSSKRSDPAGRRPGRRPERTPEERNARRLERRLMQAASTFDVAALLELLEHLGRREGSVQLLAHSTSAPQPTWVHAVELRPGGAKITANLGLLSCRSPLPDYFRQHLPPRSGRRARPHSAATGGAIERDSAVEEPLRALLRLIDDRLLERRFASYRPERDARVVPDWGAWKRDQLSLTALRSTSTLQWLFQKVYPELRVTVRRAPGAERVPTEPTRIGSAVMGRAALGGQAVLPGRGIEVTLISEDRLSPITDPPASPWPDERTPVPWAELAERRLREQIFPVLRGTGARLVVALLVLDREAVARVAEPFEPERWSHLGYDPLSHPSSDAPPAPLRVVLHAGPIPRND